MGVATVADVSMSGTDMIEEVAGATTGAAVGAGAGSRTHLYSLTRYAWRSLVAERTVLAKRCRICGAEILTAKELGDLNLHGITYRQCNSSLAVSQARVHFGRFLHIVLAELPGAGL